jgi:hypothetical protein
MGFNMTHPQFVKGKKYLILHWMTNFTMVSSQIHVRYFLHYVVHLFCWKQSTCFWCKKGENIFVPKHYSMKVDGGKPLYIFLTLVLDGGKWSVLHFDHFSPRRNLKCSFDKMLGGLKASWVLVQRDKPCLLGIIPRHPVCILSFHQLSSPVRFEDPMPGTLKSIAIWNMKPCSVVVFSLILNVILFYFSLTHIPPPMLFHFITIDICCLIRSPLLVPPIPVGLLKALVQARVPALYHYHFFCDWLTLLPWRRRQQVPQKHWYLSTKLHSIITQKVVIFKLFSLQDLLSCKNCVMIIRFTIYLGERMMMGNETGNLESDLNNIFSWSFVMFP